MPTLRLALIVVALLALVWAARRARELCVLSVRHGRVRRLRGGLPPGVQAALADVMTRARVERASIRIVRDGDHARLTARGLDEVTLQRARNVLGTVPLARLVGASRPGRRTRA